MAERKSPRAVDELISEVQELKELVAKIERRTVYLRPDGIFKSAGKQIASGILRGVGVLLGGILFLIFFGFFIQRTLTSESVQNFIGEQIQSAVDNAIDQQIESLPFH